MPIPPPDNPCRQFKADTYTNTRCGIINNLDDWQVHMVGIAGFVGEVKKRLVPLVGIEPTKPV